LQTAAHTTVPELNIAANWRQQSAQKIRTTTPEHKSSQQFQNSAGSDPAAMDQDFYAERPEQRELFLPEREHLDEDTTYLSRTGLVILLRGAPTPNLERDIARKLAEIHGRPSEQFTVSRATIAPYIVVCSEELLRDMTVRRGVYEIPEMRVQFRISEWRPRFGMAFDPPTHQAWVILRGAPLQLWTRIDIGRMLQCFGYPLHIQPFALPSGQFIEIMTLVECNHPRTIPHMIMVHEGSHATPILVYIHRWRLRGEDPFYPYHDPAEGHQRWNNQYQQVRHRNPSPRSPSSTNSNRTHQTMSTNYSARSPRSSNWTRVQSNRESKRWSMKKRNSSKRVSTEVGEWKWMPKIRRATVYQNERQEPPMQAEEEQQKELRLPTSKVKTREEEQEAR
jgi:hypothetical protein